MHTGIGGKSLKVSATHNVAVTVLLVSAAISERILFWLVRITKLRGLTLAPTSNERMNRL
jgi:hypothetical protein